MSDSRHDESRSRILVVDDERDVVEMLRDYINLAGFTVDTALNGGEALMLIQDARPDVILLDIQMPGMDGLEVLKRIQASHAAIPVIMVTASADIRLARTTLTMGAFDYVTKPIDFAALDRAIIAALESSGERSARDVGDVSPSDACRELADVVLRAVRHMTGPTRLSLPERLEEAVLGVAQAAAAGNTESAGHSLQRVQTLIRACVELGDLPQEARSHLEATLIRAQRALLRAG